YNALLAGDVAEDPYLANELENYFPTPLRKRYRELMSRHRLRREIVCTAITNSIVNRMGSAFTQRMQEETGVGVSSVARAYTIARESHDTVHTWAAIEALDNRVPANVQLSMATQTAGLLKHATRWMLDHLHGRLDIAATVPMYRSGVEVLREHAEGILNESQLEIYHRTIQQYTDVGVPEALARRIASHPLLFTAFDLVDVSAERKLPIEVVGRVYFHIGRELELDWLRDQITQLNVEGHWQAVARGTLRDDLYSQQRVLTSQALAKAGDARGAMDQLDAWFKERHNRIQHAQRVLNDMKTAGISDFPSLSVAMQEIRKLARQGN
ncbi:MAG TPA: NAD-glutamate dehydrogenase, partial [Gammaproteobacteria bacterium]|nr:NAD-glutamate dehydrogenase [Gammaproteobacteria bacterium]